MIEHMEVVGLCLLLIIGSVGVVYRYIIIPKRRLEQFSRELSMIFTRTNDIHLLVRRSSRHMMQYLGIKKVAFCIPEKGVYSHTGSHRRAVLGDDVERIMRYYRHHHSFPEVIQGSQLKDDSIKSLFQIHKTAVAIPLLHHNQLIGVVFLGERLNGAAYGRREIRALEMIATELVVAVQNALSVDEIKVLNETLQRKVDESTKELRMTNRQLQKLDKTKNEFISMASHQLRTPLTSIKGYLDMIIEGDLGKVSPTQKAVLQEAFASSERMVQLLNDFLSVSRLQTGKFIIDKKKSDISQIAREEISLLNVVAVQRSIKLKVDVAKDIPTIMIDADKIRQVILNMIDNAIYYSKPNTEVQISLSKKGEDIEFTVKDSGIGVPKAERADLFSKFFRASNARKKRPDGTGVGLFLAKKVILAHDGSIIFDSEEGVGSTFGFRIPTRQMVMSDVSSLK